jgi:hypothetical protein
MIDEIGCLSGMLFQSKPNIRAGLYALLGGIIGHQLEERCPRRTPVEFQI